MPTTETIFPLGMNMIIYNVFKKEKKKAHFAGG